MTVAQIDKIPVRTEQDIVMVRQLVRKLSQESSFSLVDQTKMVTAASELARNTLIYGGGGDLQWEKACRRAAKRSAIVVCGSGAGYTEFGIGHDGRLDLRQGPGDGSVGRETVGE